MKCLKFTDLRNDCKTANSRQDIFDVAIWGESCTDILYIDCENIRNRSQHNSAKNNCYVQTGVGAHTG